MSPVRGPDGAVWFTVGDRICRVAFDGLVTLYRTPGGEPLPLAAGPDNALWFGG